MKDPFRDTRPDWCSAGLLLEVHERTSRKERGRISPWILIFYGFPSITEHNGGRFLTYDCEGHATGSLEQRIASSGILNIVQQVR